MDWNPHAPPGNATDSNTISCPEQAQSPSLAVTKGEPVIFALILLVHLIAIKASHTSPIATRSIIIAIATLSDNIIANYY